MYFLVNKTLALFQRWVQLPFSQRNCPDFYTRFNCSKCKMHSFQSVPSGSQLSQNTECTHRFVFSQAASRSQPTLVDLDIHWKQTSCGLNLHTSTHISLWPLEYIYERAGQSQGYSLRPLNKEKTKSPIWGHTPDLDLISTIWRPTEPSSQCFITLNDTGSLWEPGSFFQMTS